VIAPLTSFIGSGAFGASAAYHLARRGVKVTVLERSALASQTSPRAAGLSSQVRATRLQLSNSCAGTRLSRETASSASPRKSRSTSSVFRVALQRSGSSGTSTAGGSLPGVGFRLGPFIVDLLGYRHRSRDGVQRDRGDLSSPSARWRSSQSSQTTGEPLRFTRSGALKIARTERDAEQFAREVERGVAAGVPIDFVSVGEARKRLPILGSAGSSRLSTVTAGDKPPPYEPAGRRNSSAVLLPHTPATGFEIGARGIEGVRTPRGTIATRVVVDAAGAWARVVAVGLGAALPVVPTRHQLLITEPIAGVGPEFPIARVIDANVYVRHERGGLLLGDYKADPPQPDVLLDDVAALPLDIEGRWERPRRGASRRVADAHDGRPQPRRRPSLEATFCGVSVRMHFLGATTRCRLDGHDASALSCSSEVPAR
jgi:glycine/D-amino acid oxidase-like deaminating enzyme